MLITILKEIRDIEGSQDAPSVMWDIKHGTWNSHDPHWKIVKIVELDLDFVLARQDLHRSPNEILCSLMKRYDVNGAFTHDFEIRVGNFAKADLRNSMWKFSKSFYLNPYTLLWKKDMAMCMSCGWFHHLPMNGCANKECNATAYV
jgi:hypothetical protein